MLHQFAWTTDLAPFSCILVTMAVMTAVPAVLTEVPGVPGDQGVPVTHPSPS